MIKYLFIIYLLFTCFSYANDCSECTAEKPCFTSQPAGDGCNTESFETWCIDGKWFRGNWGMVTSLACGPFEWPIEDPFKND